MTTPLRTPGAPDPHRVLQITSQLGLEIPAPIREAQDEAKKMQAALVEAETPMEAMAAPFRAAVKAGRNPAFDKDVQRAWVAVQVGRMGLAPFAEDVLDTAIDVAVREHQGELVALWRTEFDQAATCLITARERFGGLSLDNTKAILNLGGDIATVSARRTRQRS